MPHFQQFSSIFAAGDEWDRISATRKTVAAMLFFKYENGSYGGGPFFVWQSEEGEAVRIAKQIPIKGVEKEAMPKRIELRNAFANLRAATRQRRPDYHQEGHAEEFLIADFQTCLGILQAPVTRAVISITRSPCIGGVDAQASTNKVLIRGCYNKLLFLAARNRTLQFDVSFKIPYGAFEGNGDGAVTYMNLHRLSNNISFSWEPEHG